MHCTSRSKYLQKEKRKKMTLNEKKAPECWIHSLTCPKLNKDKYKQERFHCILYSGLAHIYACKPALEKWCVDPLTNRTSIPFCIGMLCGDHLREIYDSGPVLSVEDDIELIEVTVDQPISPQLHNQVHQHAVHTRGVV